MHGHMGHDTHGRDVMDSGDGPSAMASEQEDGSWRYDYELRLGAAPALGAVWVTPRANRDGVVFSPARVALYATTPVAVTATVADAPEHFTAIVAHDVESCDTAFLESSPSFTLRANHPSGGGKKNNREAKRLKRGFIIAGAVFIL